MHYELWIGGLKTCGSLEELRELAAKQNYHYEIFQVVKSSMGHLPSITKMNIEDMKEAQRLKDKGYDPKIISKHFGVSPWYINKVLKQMKTQTI